MKILEDLGMSYPKPTYKKKVHFVVAECPVCLVGFKTRLSTIKNGASTKCRACSNDIGNRKTHGKSESALYRKWRSMKNRCGNPNSKDYKWYGGKGVKVCKKWRNDFSKFEKWSFKNGYLPGLTIDRIDEDKNYKPSNCRFISHSENVTRANNARWGNV